MTLKELFCISLITAVMTVFDLCQCFDWHKSRRCYPRPRAGLRIEREAVRFAFGKYRGNP